MNDQNLPAEQPPEGQFLLYQTEDGQAAIECRFFGDSIWLTQRQMGDLFQTSKQNVSLHLQKIYEDGELRPEATVKQYLTVQTEGNRQVSRNVDHCKLDAIMAIGYRVRSIFLTSAKWSTPHRIPRCRDV